jgi:hypothetical protein
MDRGAPGTADFYHEVTNQRREVEALLSWGSRHDLNLIWSCPEIYNSLPPLTGTSNAAAYSSSMGHAYVRTQVPDTRFTC